MEVPRALSFRCTPRVDMSEEAATERQAPLESAAPEMAPATAQQEPSTHQNGHGPATAPDNEHLRRRVLYVSANQPALLRLPSGMTKQVVLEPGKTVSIGKFGSFAADDVIGRPYGPTYEIQADGHLEIMHQDVAEALSTSPSLTPQRRTRPQMKTYLTMASRSRFHTKTSRRSKRQARLGAYVWHRSHRKLSKNSSRGTRATTCGQRTAETRS